MLGKVTFDDHVNALERYWKSDISYTFYTTLMALFSQLRAIKGLILRSVRKCTFYFPPFFQSHVDERAPHAGPGGGSLPLSMVGGGRQLQHLRSCL